MFAAHPQNSSEPSERIQFSFFSGRVDDFSDDFISVSRELASRKHEVRSFIRTPETVIRGSLRKGARVTVAFTHVDGGYVAHRVIIRG